MPATHSARCGAAALVAALALAAPHAAGAQTLVELLAAAEARDGRLAAALAARDGAAEHVAMARARLQPQLQLQGTAQAMDQSSRSTAVPDAAALRYSGRSGNVQLQLRQALLRPRDWAGLDVGQAQAELGAVGVLAGRADLWRRTTELWIDLLGARDTLAAATAAEAALAALVDAEEARLARGEGTRHVLVETRAQLALGRSRQREAASALHARRQALERSTGLVLAAPVGAADRPRGADLARLLAEPMNGRFDDYLAAARTLNPDVQRLLLEAEVSRQRLRQARADHLPSLDLVASSSQSENDSPDALGRRYTIQRIGIQFQLPLYSGGGLDAAQRQAQAQVAASDAELRGLLQDTEQRLLLEWATMDALADRIHAQDQMVESGREQVRAAQAGVATGLRSAADLAAAQSQLAQRQAERIASAVAYLKARLRIAALLPPGHPAWQALQALLSPAT